MDKKPKDFTSIKDNYYAALNKQLAFFSGFLPILHKKHLAQGFGVVEFSNCIKINRFYHHFVQGQENPPECQRFAVHNEACQVVEVAYL